MHVIIYVGYLCVFKFICYDLFQCFESSGAAKITHMLQIFIVQNTETRFHRVFYQGFPFIKYSNNRAKNNILMKMYYQLSMFV